MTAELRAVARGLSAGELNYALSIIVRDSLPAPFKYDDLLRAHGTFGAAGAEFYRLVVAPYEDWKISENGSAYPGLGQ